MKTSTSGLYDLNVGTHMILINLQFGYLDCEHVKCTVDRFNEKGKTTYCIFSVYVQARVAIFFTSYIIMPFEVT